MREYSGIITKWQIHNLSNGTRVFTGEVVQDYKGRWQPGVHMRSSIIKRIVDCVIYTSNSMYRMDGFEGDPVANTYGELLQLENFTGDLGDDVVGITY